MPKIDVDSLPLVAGSTYPSPFDEPCRMRTNKRLGLAGGLTQFGVNLTRLHAGAWSSQRHFHEREDEFVYILEGEVVLVTDDAEETLRAGDCAGFKAGERNGHHLQNRSDQDAVFLTIGSRDDQDSGEYPDIDLAFGPGRYSGKGRYLRKDGTPY